jgi:hypothetical protein
MQPSAVESVFRATLLPQEVKRHIYFIYLAYACYGGAVVVNLNRGIVGPIASAAMATHPVARAAAAAQAPKKEMTSGSGPLWALFILYSEQNI